MTTTHNEATNALSFYASLHTARSTDTLAWLTVADLLERLAKESPGGYGVSMADRSRDARSRAAYILRTGRYE